LIVGDVEWGGGEGGDLVGEEVQVFEGTTKRRREKVFQECCGHNFCEVVIS
jgi:hypothetical protein